ncbi:MAG TPA: ribose-phosphate pyrophosphokinase [Sphingomicrobium sp.]|nr:ribose-phosphate pyrophosphokinase [Sphingomicrobium sp.]
MSISDPAEIRAHLVAAASAGHPLTYSELLAQLGHAFSRPKMRALCKTLGTVDDEAAIRREPELAVLVVRQSDGLPGQGWWVAGGGTANDYAGPWEGAEAAAFIRRLQQNAFDFWAMADDAASS